MAFRAPVTTDCRPIKRNMSKKEQVYNSEKYRLELNSNIKFST